ncbi:MAG: DNA mismatch repair endonuclease MutL [Bryobacterales bacterium]|nr:DNA mismatch repair endonuclease MutL [Bryobacterales bacterium]MBV9397249.1 DNA mismatch repair endonuclease MutL [Bryobacterales bacterium]
MGRIRILSDNVANKIAAGEVVERPASVVKELLENSLDAGATEFRLDIEAGGRRLIRLVDNGSGMMRDDALLAFERHATSKLSDVKDLLSIATLGFRGEALPSIASVSRLVLETRTREQQAGTTVEFAGGKLIRCDEAALAPGTSVTVRDLFYNVPARKKFLRSEQTETAHVASLITHYSLAHPAKTFLLRHNNSELLNVTPVESLKERVFQVFGSRILDDLLDAGEHWRDLAMPPEPDEAPAVRRFRLRGFVSNPQVQKLNRNSIYLFVNGRLIRDRLLLHAISAAYHNLMPPACWPFALLFLDCEAEEVDVNVHPSKTEVRFRHSSVVHDFVRDTVREILIAGRPASRIPAVSPAQPAAGLPYSEFTQNLENLTLQTPIGSAAQAAAALMNPSANPSELPEFHLRRPPSPAPRFDFTEVLTPAAYGSKTAVPDTHGPVFSEAMLPLSANLDSLRDLRPLGQIHDSFIVAAGRDGLWIIDQHVAHERILFEKVLSARGNGAVETQRVLIPPVIGLTAAQQIEYARIAGELESLGFETEPFGNRTIAVKSAPAGLAAADIEKVIFEILEISESELRKTSLDDLRRAMAASIACRAAIKINTRLDPAKVEWLLRALAETSCPMSCPHGRPIALLYSTREILKSFHRI